MEENIDDSPLLRERKSNHLNMRNFYCCYSVFMKSVPFKKNINENKSWMDLIEKNKNKKLNYREKLVKQLSWEKNVKFGRKIRNK